MKNLWIGIAGALLWMAGTAAAQQQTASAPDAPMLFPRHWVRGYVDFQVAPPHNEPDLGRCFASAATFGGVNAPCAAFARYLVGGYVELQPFGRTALKHVFLFAKPMASLGNNIPKLSYTWVATPIALDNTFGIGYELPRGFEVRAVQHEITWLGRYRNYLGYGDLGPGGLYGNYTTVGARWNFGGYERMHETQ